MTIFFGDGADHYGDDEELLLEGAYSQADGITVEQENPRTGTGHFRFESVNNAGLRIAFPSEKVVVGCGFGFTPTELPSNSTTVCIFQPRDDDNEPQCSVYLSSTGQIVARQGDKVGPELGRSAPVIRAGGYQHIETRIECDPVDGTVEVRVNGVTVLNLTGKNTNDSPTKKMSQAVIVGSPGTTNTGFLGQHVDFDDLLLWDDEGISNNTFIGDKKLFLRKPSSDTVDADWVPEVGATGYANIDNTPPLDDSEFITAADAGDLSAFGLENIPPEVVTIAAVITWTRAYKDDAGAATITVGMRNGGTTLSGDPHTISQAPNFYVDVFEVDPDTDAPWAPSGYDTAEVVLERTE